MRILKLKAYPRLFFQLKLQGAENMDYEEDKDRMKYMIAVNNPEAEDYRSEIWIPIKK